MIMDHSDDDCLPPRPWAARSPARPPDPALVGSAYRRLLEMPMGPPTAGTACACGCCARARRRREREERRPWGWWSGAPAEFADARTPRYGEGKDGEFDRLFLFRLRRGERPRQGALFWTVNRSLTFSSLSFPRTHPTTHPLTVARVISGGYVVVQVDVATRNMAAFGYDNRAGRRR
jgi:hypothetical protein